MTADAWPEITSQPTADHRKVLQNLTNTHPYWTGSLRRKLECDPPRPQRRPHQPDIGLFPRHVLHPEARDIEVVLGVTKGQKHNRSNPECGAVIQRVNLEPPQRRGQDIKDVW